MTIDTETMKKIGSEWEKYGKHRIYFNDLADLLNIEVSRYNTGNISNVQIDWIDSNISNSKGSDFLYKLSGAKFYYDLINEKFVLEHGEFPYVTGEEVKSRLVDAVTSKK